MEYELLTDSTCDLPIEIIKEHNIGIVNFTLHMDGQDYIDDLGISFDKESFFKKLKEGSIATTSQVSTGTYYDVFKSYADRKMPVLYLAISSELSGSYQSAISALQMLKEEIPDCEVAIVDTQAATLGEGLLVYKAAKLKEKGYSLNELVQWIEENKKNVQSWVTVDDIKHLQRGGRISAASATIGTLLKVKPIIVINKEGKLVSFAKTRGRKKALQFLAEMTLDYLTDLNDQVLFIGHIGAKEDAEAVKSMLNTKLTSSNIIVTEFGPSISTHIGYGAIAVFSMGKPRDIE